MSVTWRGRSQGGGAGMSTNADVIRFVVKLPSGITAEEAADIKRPFAALLAEVEQLRLLVEAADEHARQPIDLNYIAVPKDAWEDITRAVRG